MLKLWKQACDKAQPGAEEQTDSTRRTESVVTSGAADCEPVDSAVRVTVPTQRQTLRDPNTSTGEASGSRPRPRSPYEKDDDLRVSKRRKVENDSRVNELVVVYEPSTTPNDTELYLRLYRTYTDSLLLRNYKNARRVLVELGPCAADLVRDLLQLMYHIQLMERSYGESPWKASQRRRTKRA